jgi:hypothetical protein
LWLIIIPYFPFIKQTKRSLFVDIGRSDRKGDWVD